MSSISSVSSATNLYQTTAPISASQSIEDFQAIGTALQSGDLASAQSALSTFQQQLQTDSATTANQPFGKNFQANTDYQSLVTALKSGDTSSAQKAFTSLQTDLKTTQTASKTHKGHHHHHGASAAGTTSSLTTATSTTAATSTDTSTTNGSGGILDVSA